MVAAVSTPGSFFAARKRAARAADARGLLLVACSPDWTTTVHAVAREFEGVNVAACNAREALVRVAATPDRYSHLLVENCCDGGLLDALADLTSRASGSETEMLMLGMGATKRQDLIAIPSANPSSVREALMPRSDRIPAEQAEIRLSDLRDALRGSMIETRYQPIVRMSDRRPMALESLARLNHPALGMIMPDRFVPQIEHAGLAAELTERVSACTFADMVGPYLAGLDLRVTVNFPLDVILMPDALARLEGQRDAAGLPADRVIVELTESRPVEDFDGLRVSLEMLRRLGYRIAIDDVGPAVPRLAPLLDLPFTTLKLDKELVQRIETDPEIDAFLARTTDEAHKRGLIVVAEGVETLSIWNRMREIGVDDAQGYLVARPLPVSAVPVWLEAWIKATSFG